MQAPKPKKAKRPAVDTPPKQPKAKAAKPAADKDGGGEKKKKRKKDKNAPKNALSAFMYFSSAHREQVTSSACLQAYLHVAVAAEPD